VDGLNRNAFQFAYNADGWLTNRWTPEKGNTGYAFDNVGNLKTITYPSSTNSYRYDADNRLTNMVDAVGTNVFTYTSAGRLAGESNAWAAVSYSYLQGLRTAMSIGSWSQTYDYDSSWRMSSVASPAGAFGYSYSFSPASSLVTGISLPNGANIVNSYDSLARFKTTDLNNYWGHTLDGYSYSLDPLGLRTNIVRNLGLTSSSVSVGYDNIGQITSWLAKETNGVPRLNEQLGLGYDSADNLHSRTNNLLTQTFNVDAANELTNVSRSGTLTLSGATPAPATNIIVNGQAGQTYGDFTFAITNLSLANGNNTFTNVAANVYGVRVTNTFTANLPSSVNLNFDNNGSLTNDGTRSFAYDSENQLTNVMVAEQWQSSFIYDGLNRRRIERDYSWNGSGWVKTNEVHFIYDGYRLVQERDTNNNVLVTYTRGLDLSGSLQGAGGIGGLLARTDGNGSTFYHADGAEDITALMDGSQNVLARYLYNPFGKLVGTWGSMAGVNEMQFSSMPQHDGLELYPFRAYEPNFQRFLNQDPIQEAGGINLYRANFNDPLRYVDPFGLQEDAEDVIPESAETPQEQFQDELDENQVFGAQRPGFPEVGPEPNWENEPKLPEGQYESDIAQATQEIADDLEKDSEPKLDNPITPKVPCPSVLYRGVARGSVHDIQQATGGGIVPRGGTASPEAHVNEVNTASPYTSWTADINVAQRFAGPGGPLFQVNVNEIPNTIIDTAPFSAHPNESEFLIVGPIYGVTRLPNN
jgi:RHS repeat-associated protein